MSTTSINIVKDKTITKITQITKSNKMQSSTTTITKKPVLVSYSAIPLHSHNNTLQIWLELGLIGIIIFNLFVFCLLKNIFNLTNKNLIKIPFLVGGFICIFLINQSSFGLWQTWWLAIITFFSFIFRLISEKKD